MPGDGRWIQSRENCDAAKNYLRKDSENLEGAKEAKIARLESDDGSKKNEGSEK